MEHLRLASGIQFAATKPLTRNNLTVAGWASKFDVPIDCIPPSVIRYGAFKDTLKEQGDRVKILWQHSMDEPIGRPVKLQERPEGLWVEAALIHTVQRAVEAYDLVQQGVVTDWSIGFDPVLTQPLVINGQTYREIVTLRLWEVSLVTVGAQRGASVVDTLSNPMLLELEKAAADTVDIETAGVVAALHSRGLL